MHSIRVQVSVQTPDHMYLLGLQRGTLVQALPQSEPELDDRNDATCDGTSLPPLLSFDPQPYRRDRAGLSLSHHRVLCVHDE